MNGTSVESCDCYRPEGAFNPSNMGEWREDRKLTLQTPAPELVSHPLFARICTVLTSPRWWKVRPGAAKRTVGEWTAT